MQWVPWMKTCTCTGMFRFLESTRNCPLQFLMDLSNCPLEKHFLELRMLSQETSGRKSGPDPIQPVASWLLLDLNFLLGMKAESLPVPSVSLHQFPKFAADWQLPCLQSTSFTPGIFFRYFCVLPDMLSFCSMQGNDPMGRACCFEELNTEILLAIISFNFSSAFKTSVRVFSWILSWPHCRADGMMPGWDPEALLAGLLWWSVRSFEATSIKILFSTRGRSGFSGSDGFS